MTLKSSSGGTEWRDLDAGGNSHAGRLSLIAAIAVAALAVLGLELTCSDVREWLVDHPATVALGTGLAVLLVGALGLEPLLARIESRRWRGPAQLALDSYIFSADRAAQRVDERLKELVLTLPSPPAHAPLRRADALELLLQNDRGRLREFSAFVREQVDDLTGAATQAVAVAGRYGPYAWSVQDVFQEQQRLADVAEHANFLSFVGGGLGGPKDATFRQFADEHRDATANGLQGFVDEVHRMRGQVLEARERVQ